MACFTDHAPTITSQADQPVPLRIGDRDRAEATDRLAAHAAAGRLSTDELEQRLEAVNAARDAADLRAIERDLPAIGPRRNRRRTVPLAPLLVLIVAALASVLVGHPLPPLFAAAAVLWLASRRAITRRADPPRRPLPTPTPTPTS